MRVEDEFDPFGCARRRERALPFRERHDLRDERLELDSPVADELEAFRQEVGVLAKPEVIVSSWKQTRSKGSATGLPARPIWT